MVLVEFSCPACRRPVIWALKTATVKCPYCTRWLTEHDIVNPAKMDTESDQMILF